MFRDLLPTRLPRCEPVYRLRFWISQRPPTSGSPAAARSVGNQSKDYNRAALDKAKDILGHVYEYFLLHYVRNETVDNEALPVQAMVLLHPIEVSLCLTGTVSKIC